MPAGVWAEQMTESEVEPLLGDLGSSGTTLHLSLPAARVGDPGLARLTRSAAELGVDTYFWPLLPARDGYWFGKSNAAVGAELVDRILAWCAGAAGPRISGLSLDLEPPLALVEELRAVVWRQPWRAARLLYANLDRASLSDARTKLGRAVDRIRSAKLRVHAVTYPFLLDQAPGHSGLEDLLDLVATGLPWDEISVMVYQTVFHQFSRIWFGPDLVYSYARSAVARWGERAGLDLGVVGGYGVALDPGARYQSPAVLHRDVAAALAAGITPARLRVYGLRGLAQSGGVKRWMDWSGVAPELPVGRASVLAVRALAAGFDRVLALRDYSSSLISWIPSARQRARSSR